MTLEQQQALAMANARLRLQESAELPVSQSNFAETGGGAAVGRPMSGVRLNVQETPRPLESFMAGATKSAVDPLMAGAQLVTGGREIGRAHV